MRLWSLRFQLVLSASYLLLACGGEHTPLIDPPQDMEACTPCRDDGAPCDNLACDADATRLLACDTTTSNWVLQSECPMGCQSLGGPVLCSMGNASTAPR